MMQTQTTRVFAPAKINWVLTVERKRPDGFHDIHTIFQALSWGDELICAPAPAGVCQIECDHPSVPTGPDNLIARAWRRLAEAYPERVGGLHVRLIKRIPAGAGLGGGSADAAAALVAVRRLYGLALGLDELERHAAAIGSDCAFFIRGGTAAGTGRGERLTPIAGRLPALWLVVVFPGFTSPTAEAYRRLRPEHWEDGRQTERVRHALEKGDLAGLKKLTKNIFNDLAVSNDPRYKELADRMARQGLERPMMSGSGSAMFAWAASPAHARRACQGLRQDYPVAISARPRRRGVALLAGSHSKDRISIN